MWTQFWDMHSGGSTKEPPYEKIYIEAPEEEAKVIFYNRFGHNPERVTCTCCGDDYSISESETLEEATGYQRGCDYDNEANRYVDRPKETYASYEEGYQTVEQYEKKAGVLIIRAKDIKPEERKGDVPEQGYVWRD